MTNWKTNLAGLALLIINIGNIVVPTLPPQYATVANGVIAAIGLFMARDARIVVAKK